MPLLARAARSMAIVACTLALTACGPKSVAPPVTAPPAPTPDVAPPAAPTPKAVEPSDTATAPDSAGAAVAAPPACLLGSGDGEPIESVGLTDPVNPANAPYPVNAGEALLFRQIYESPLRIDCEHEPRPALAEAWQVEPDGTWTLTLRSDARFTDGVLVTGDAIVTAWADAGTGTSGSRAGRHVLSATALDARRVSVRLRDGVSAPAVFAHTDLAVFRRLPGAAWPVGTRAVRPESDSMPAAATGRTRLTLVGPTSGPAAPDGSGKPQASIRFLIAPGADPRDLLDEGTDLLVTGDRRALEYAETLARYDTVPLAWNRTYVLLSRTTGPIQPLSDEARAALARDGVRGEARGAEAAVWRETIAACQALQAPVAPTGAPAMRRIVFDAGDDTARDLAERIVGLAGTRSPSAVAMLDGLLPRSHQSLQRAIGLAGQALASALKTGSDAGYVVEVGRTSVDRCRAIESLRDRIPWFDPAAAVPLVETRARAIIRRSRSGLVHGGDDALLLGVPAGGRGLQ